MSLQTPCSRSFVIPVLDFSPHSPYNIRTLLADLEKIPGEVICIFNSREVYEALADHPRIDKYCYNKWNAGVSRSWNMGLNLAEGRSVFILNADLHLGRTAVEMMEYYLFTLDRAAMVGPQGGFVDYKALKDTQYFHKGQVHIPIKCYSISGFLFAVHRERFQEHGLAFDVRFSPCFFEEWDIGLQIMKAGLACYVVPVTDYDHHWGVSANSGDQTIHYFGREWKRDQILNENSKKFIEKWAPLLEGDGRGGESCQPPQVEADGQLISEDGLDKLIAFIRKVQGQVYAEPLSATNQQVTETMLPQVLRRYHILPNARILDVGCGQGPALKWLTEHGYRPVGITLCREDVEVCRRNGYEVYPMDQSFLNFPDDSFDLLWVRHCIEHSIFPFYTLSEFYRVLKPGGILYLEIPAPETPARHETNANHYSILPSGMWMSLLERTGFFQISRADITVAVPIGQDTYWAFMCRKPYLTAVNAGQAVIRTAELR